MAKYKLEKKRIIFNAHYKHSVDFFQKQYDIMKELMGDMPHYHITSLDCTVENKEKHISQKFTHKRSIFEYDEVNDKVEDAKQSIKAGLEAYNKFVPIETFSSLLLRTFIFIPMKEIEVEELADIYWKKFFVKNSDVEDIVGENIDDLSYNVNFSKDGFFYRVASGPMPKKQIVQVVDFGDLNMRFDNDDEAREYTGNYPDISVFIDMTCGKKDVPFGEKDNFLKGAFESTNQIAAKLNTYLLG